MSFTKKIIVSMILGIIIGIAFNLTDLIESTLGSYITSTFDLISYIFLSSLKLIIIPLIFFSIVCGIISLSDDVSISRLGIKTLLSYTVTTVIAISLGLFFSSFISYEPIQVQGLDNVIDIGNIENDASIFPDNIFKSLTEGNIIHLLIFAVLIGISASRIKGKIKTFIQYFYDFNDVINELVKIIISFTPLAVFCILAKTFSTQGVETIMPLASYFFTVVFVLLFHFFFTFSILLRAFYCFKSDQIFPKLKRCNYFYF